MSEGNKQDHGVAPQGRKRNCSSALLGITGTVHLSQRPGPAPRSPSHQTRTCQAALAGLGAGGPGGAAVRSLVERLSEAWQRAVRPVSVACILGWGGHRRDQELSPSPCCTQHLPCSLSLSLKPTLTEDLLGHSPRDSERKATDSHDGSKPQCRCLLLLCISPGTPFSKNFNLLHKLCLLSSN